MGEIIINMSFCQKHWDQLREQIDTIGLGHLVAKNDEEATKRSENRTATNFEPLIYAHEAILRHALHLLGPYEGCPVCSAQIFHDSSPCSNPECPGDVAKDWIEGSSGDALEYAKEHGLVHKGN
jgi:hypothetical protein